MKPGEGTKGLAGEVASTRYYNTTVCTVVTILLNRVLGKEKQQNAAGVEFAGPFGVSYGDQEALPEAGHLNGRILAELSRAAWILEKVAI